MSISNVASVRSTPVAARRRGIGAQKCSQALPSYPNASGAFQQIQISKRTGPRRRHYHDTADISDYGLKHQHIRARPNVPFSEHRAFEPEGPLIVLIVRVVLHRSAGLCLWCFSCCCRACSSPDLLPGLASERGSHAGGGENGPLPGSRTVTQAGTSCTPKRLRWILLEIIPIRSDVGRHGSPKGRYELRGTGQRNPPTTGGPLMRA